MRQRWPHMARRRGDGVKARPRSFPFHPILRWPSPPTAVAVEMSSNAVSRSSQEWEKDAKDIRDAAPAFLEYTKASEDDLFEQGSVDPIYEAKARLLNHAVREIGMGRYQVGSCPVQISETMHGADLDHSGTFSS